MSKNRSEKDIQGDISRIMNSDNLLKMMDSSDILGVVLRAHFGLESALDYWCDKITNNNNFFDFGFIGFDKKLSIAHKLGLPNDVYAVFKEFNKIRNSSAHQINLELDLSTLDRIKDKIYLIDTGSLDNPDLSSGSVYIKGKTYKWDDDKMSISQRFITLYLVFSFKLIYVFGTELLKRNISFHIK